MSRKTFWDFQILLYNPLEDPPLKVVLSGGLCENVIVTIAKQEKSQNLRVLHGLYIVPAANRVARGTPNQQ